MCIFWLYFSKKKIPCGWNLLEYFKFLDFLHIHKHLWLDFGVLFLAIFVLKRVSYIPIPMPWLVLDPYVSITQYAAVNSVSYVGCRISLEFELQILYFNLFFWACFQCFEKFSFLYIILSISGFIKGTPHSYPICPNWRCCWFVGIMLVCSSEWHRDVCALWPS